MYVFLKPHIKRLIMSERKMLWKLNTISSKIILICVHILTEVSDDNINNSFYKNFCISYTI